MSFTFIGGLGVAQDEDRRIQQAGLARIFGLGRTPLGHIATWRGIGSFGPAGLEPATSRLQPGAPPYASVYGTGSYDTRTRSY